MSLALAVPPITRLDGQEDFERRPRSELKPLAARFYRDSTLACSQLAREPNFPAFGPGHAQPLHTPPPFFHESTQSHRCGVTSYLSPSRPLYKPTTLPRSSQRCFHPQSHPNHCCIHPRGLCLLAVSVTLPRPIFASACGISPRSPRGLLKFSGYLRCLRSRIFATRSPASHHLSQPKDVLILTFRLPRLASISFKSVGHTQFPQQHLYGTSSST